MSRIFNFGNSNLTDDFGLLLTEENLEAHLESLDLKRKSFVSSHKVEVSRVAKWVKGLKETMANMLK